MRRVQRVLWAIGGFDAATLSREECRSVRPKYSAMGLLVLITALMATCSGGYALWTVFNSLQVAIPLGFLWGMLILALDRLLVSSMRKTATLKDYFIGTHTVPPYQPHAPWVPIVLRVALACVIGIVVAKPIEARLMRPLVIQRDVESGDRHLREVENSPAIITFREQVRQLRERLLEKQRDVDTKAKELACEADGTCGTEKYGDGPVAAQKRELYRQAQEEAKQLSQDVQSKEQELETERRRVLDREHTIIGRREQDESFIKALISIHELSITQDGNAGFISLVSLALTALFVLIESTPVLAKGLSPFDAYDAILQELEHGAILNALSATRDEHQKVMTGLARAAAAGGD